MFPSWTKPLLGSPSGSMKLRLDWEAASQPIELQTGAKIPKDPRLQPQHRQEGKPRRMESKVIVLKKTKRETKSKQPLDCF